MHKIPNFPINEQKSSLEIRLKAIILKHIAIWTDNDNVEEFFIPLVRDGKTVGTLELPGTISGHNDPKPSIARVIAATNNRISSKDMEASIKQLEQQAKLLRSAIAEFERPNEETRSTTYEPTLSKEYSDVQAVIQAIGINRAISVACKMHLEITEKLLNYQKKDYEKLVTREGKTKGRKRNHQAYDTAYELARLYSKITGKLPTNGETDGQVYGNFTPALRDIFDACGWKSLQGPLKEAVGRITDEDLGIEQKKPSSATEPPLGVNSWWASYLK